MERLPLYCRYPGERYAQPAHLAIDLESQEYAWGYNPEIGGAIPEAVYHRRVLWVSVDPRLTDEQLLEVENDPRFDELLRLIFEASHIEWDGQNRVGRLDDDAEMALEELEDWLSSIEPEVTVWSDPAHWLADVAEYRDGRHYLDGVPVTEDTLPTLLETYQEEEGGDVIPDLHEYIRGLVR